MTTRNFRVHNGISVGDIVISASANTISGLATAAPSADGDVSNKKYVDDSIAAISTTAINQGNSNVTVTDSGTGAITVSADATEVANFAAAATTITATGAINLTAGSDVVIPANIGLTFGTGEKIEGDSTDLTITSGGAINLTAVTDVVIPANVGITFGTGEKIEGDNTDLTITSGADITLAAAADVNIPVNVGLRFGDGGENIETDNTDLTITSGGLCTITATSTTAITNNATVGGTLGVTGLTTVAALTTTGALTLGGAVAIGDLNILADGTITTDSNGDFVVDPAGTGAIVLTGPITATGVQTTTGQLNVDNLRMDGNTLSATSGAITLTPAAGQNVAVTGTNTRLTAGEANFTLMEAVTVRADALQNDTSDGDLAISTQGTGVVSVASQLTLTGSFLPAIHTFVATDAVTVTEHAGRTLLLGEVGGNALVTLTLPVATGSGATYKFIVSVTNTSNYVIAVPDANNTIDGVMLYLDEDGTAVTAFPTVAASDTITLNGTTTGGVLGDYLEIVDIAADQYHVRGVMRVPAGSNPVTPFSAAV